MTPTPLRSLPVGRRLLPGLGLLCAAILPCGCRQSTFPAYPEGYREFAYVANSGSNTVTVLDLVYLRPDRTLRVGIAPVAAALNPKRDEVYVVNAQPEQASGSLSIIDTSHNVVVATIQVHHVPSFVSVDPTGHRAFVANSGSNTVTVIDLDARRAIASFPTGEKPVSAIVSPDGRSLVVPNRTSGSISIFSIAPLQSSGSSRNPAPPLSLRSTFTGCPGAASAVILPDSSKTFIACSGGHQVMALNLSAAPNSWAARQDASLEADHLLALLDVGQSPSNLTLKPDGGEVFVSNLMSDSVSEIATDSNEVGSTFVIGNLPSHGVVSADNGALWVSNSGADSISLYSIDDGKFLSSLRTGTAPDALAFSADEAQQLLLAADTRSGDVAVIRTAGRLGPALLTILPAGAYPSAIVVKAMQAKP